MSNGTKVVKRNGTIEPLDLDKMHLMVEEACKGLAGVSASQVEMTSGIQFYSGISTQEIQEILIRSASDLIDLDHPNYQFVAARLLLFAVRKQLYGKMKELPPLEQHIYQCVNHEVYDRDIFTKYSKEEIDKIVSDLKHTATVLYKKNHLRVPDLMDIQNYVLISLYYGHIVPRRAMDYVMMLYKNYVTEKDNYVDFKNKKLVFNQYKTATKMGETLKGRQELPITPSLLKILKKWVDVIPKEIDNLFFNSNLEPLSNVSLNQRLNMIFRKKASVNALRHFYLTSKYKTLMEENEKMEQDMQAMGSSSEQAKVYIKINEKEE